MAGFRGFPGGGMNGANMQQMMRQAQKMQQDLQKAQEELKETEFVGEAGGDMVQVTMMGDKSLVSVWIDPQVIDPDDKEMLEDLIVAAFNDVMDQIDERSQEILGPYAGMLGGM